MTRFCLLREPLFPRGSALIWALLPPLLRGRRSLQTEELLVVVVPGQGVTAPACLSRR